MRIRKPEDLDKLDKEGLIEFLRSDREDKVELWNRWRVLNVFNNDATVDLEGAGLNGAHLEGAGLYGARLEGAHLGGAHLEKANLYLAHLRGAHLMEAHLEGAALSEAHLEEANLTLAHLEGAELFMAHLEGANLLAAHLEGASLVWAHLEAADFIATYLEGAELRRINFRDVAVGDVAAGGLRGARLYGSNFHGMLSLRYTQLLEDEANPNSPSTLWEETEGHFSEAKDVYKNLKGYFEDMGDYEGANWAYEREQVMEKLIYAPPVARWLYRLNTRWRGQWQPDKDGTTYWKPNVWEWLRLEVAEKTANYGLSLWHPLMCIVGVVILFALIYWLGGLITAMPECAYGASGWHEGCTPSANPLDALVFSLGSLTSTEIVAVQPYRSHVGLIQTVEVLLGIAFTGLFGFVLGNRLRYS